MRGNCWSITTHYQSPLTVKTFKLDFTGIYGLFYLLIIKTLLCPPSIANRTETEIEITMIINFYQNYYALVGTEGTLLDAADYMS